MPHTRKTEEASMSSLTDRISALSDGALQNVIGFLPADEAVRTSVLARRWRHQWRFMPRVRITSSKVWDMTADDVKEFINNMLFLRDPNAMLDEIYLDYSLPEDGATYADIFIRDALLCQPKVLHAMLFADMSLQLYGPPLISNHLRTLELSFLDFKGTFLDFSSCPSLETLKMSECIISTSRILSPSVKHLSINLSGFWHDIRTRITLPSLVTLQLLDSGGERTPLLENMTSLETAIVSPCRWDDSYCGKGDSGECCGTCANCRGYDDHGIGCILLGGLSSATNLKLITESPGKIIFRRDLRWCPTFGKLKTLLLSDWCVEADLSALVCMLEHSPVLENLTLLLCKGPKRTLEREESYGLMEKPASISERLKIVIVHCNEVDERVHKILKFLSTSGIKVTLKRETCFRYGKICHPRDHSG